MMIFYKIKHCIVDAYWAVIYAFQRMFRGYDNRDIFDFDYRFLERNLKILKDFRKNHYKLFIDYNPFRTMTEEETNAILDHMIERCEKATQTDKWTEWIGIDEVNDKMEAIQRWENDCYEARKEFFELFIIYFNQLWY